MQKSMASLILFAVALASPNAFATADDVNGKTTCTILKNDNAIKKAPCTYSGMSVGSIRYNGLGLDFLVKGYGKISTSVSNSAKTDKDGNMLNDPNPDKGVWMNPTEMTLNNKPAILFTRNKNFKPVSEKVMEAMSEKEANQSFNCMKQLKTGLEICVPAKDLVLAN